MWVELTACVKHVFLERNHLQGGESYGLNDALPLRLVEIAHRYDLPPHGLCCGCSMLGLTCFPTPSTSIAISAIPAQRAGASSTTIPPNRGLVSIQRMPDKPVQEIVVALAGPLVNVVIVVLIFSWAGVSVDLSTARLVIQRENSLATQLATVNVWLALFDLIPAFPMDGGRVLRALIALKLPYGEPPASQRLSARHSLCDDLAAIRCFAGTPRIQEDEKRQCCQILKKQNPYRNTAVIRRDLPLFR